MSPQRERTVHAELIADLPLRRPTPRSWAVCAAADLDAFLADHAVCEQAAALAALNLVTHYPEDEELVERMTSLALEEVSHLRRVAHLLRERGRAPARRRTNRYAAGLHAHVTRAGEPWRKVDRLMVGALIEARSCERFTRLLEEIETREPALAALLVDLGPAEKRHWLLFHRLAARDVDPAAFEGRWQAWLDREDALQDSLGTAPTVHG